MNELLPVGTIVTVMDDSIELEIVGYGGQGENEIYDYIGFVYPYGFLGRDKIVLFNKDKVRKVVHDGYRYEKYPLFVEETTKMIDAAREAK